MSQRFLSQEFDRKYQGALRFRAVNYLRVFLRQMCLSQVKRNSKTEFSVMSQGLLNQKFDRKYQGAFSFRAVTNFCVSLRQMCLSQVKGIL